MRNTAMVAAALAVAGSAPPGFGWRPGEADQSARGVEARRARRDEKAARRRADASAKLAAADAKRKRRAALRQEAGR